MAGLITKHLRAKPTAVVLQTDGDIAAEPAESCSQLFFFILCAKLTLLFGRRGVVVVVVRWAGLRWVGWRGWGSVCVWGGSSRSSRKKGGMLYRFHLSHARGYGDDAKQRTNRP